MNRTEVIAVAILFAMLVALGIYQRPRPQEATASPASTEEASTNVQPREAAVIAPVPSVTPAPPVATATPPVEAVAALVPAGPDQELTLTSSALTATISARSGGVRSMVLSHYLEKQGAEDKQRLDFATAPALDISSQGWAWTGSIVTNGGVTNSIRLAYQNTAGLTLNRELSFTSDYLLTVRDTVTNGTASPLTLKGYELITGPMPETGGSLPYGMQALGIDSLSAHGGENVRYWGKDIASVIFNLSSGMSCSAPDATGAPETARHELKVATDWVSAKNRFFVQMLLADTPTAGMVLEATRDMKLPSLKVASVAAGLRYADSLLNPGEATTCEVEYFVGPKSLTLLKALGRDAHETMEFGRYIGWICELMLTTLNGIHRVIPSYGIAIMLLTLIVRMLLWPITAKSVRSMKRMAELKPRMDELNAKYKDKPQKRSEELMKLYKTEKINPMAGCLPLLLQLPIFIALYTMLQSAVELRYASFLWVRDLSAAELLLGGTAAFGMFPLSIMGGINLLPLFMTAATIWQMKLTPSGGDPQQQQIMRLMPWMMLFMTYNMAAGLMLYWTASTLISIAQTKISGTAKPVATSASVKPKAGARG